MEQVIQTATYMVRAVVAVSRAIGRSTPFTRSSCNGRLEEQKMSHDATGSPTYPGLN